MLHTAASRRSVKDVAELLPAIVARHQFGTLGSTDLRAKMNEKVLIAIVDEAGSA